MECSYKTDTGLVRQNNEDDFLIAQDLHLLVIADGMGGYNGGETASKMAVREVAASIARESAVSRLSEAKDATQENILIYRPDDNSARRFLRQAVQAANHKIFMAAQQDERYRNMGTTVTAAYIAPTDDKVTVAHVGDSRAYLYRQGSLLQLTNDHSYVGELVASGEITAEEAVKHPQRNVITRAVGVDADLKVDCYELDLLPGDLLLLCTDGFYAGCTNSMLEQQLTDMQKTTASLQQLTDRLMQAALERGGQDNITVILLKL